MMRGGADDPYTCRKCVRNFHEAGLVHPVLDVRFNEKQTWTGSCSVSRLSTTARYRRLHVSQYQVEQVS